VSAAGQVNDLSISGNSALWPMMTYSSTGIGLDAPKPASARDLGPRRRSNWRLRWDQGILGY
jgi:hypothetical protein